MIHGDPLLGPCGVGEWVKDVIKWPKITSPDINRYLEERSLYITNKEHNLLVLNNHFCTFERTEISKTVIKYTLTFFMFYSKVWIDMTIT